MIPVSITLAPQAADILEFFKISQLVENGSGIKPTYTLCAVCEFIPEIRGRERAFCMSGGVANSLTNQPAPIAHGDLYMLGEGEHVLTR